MNKNSSEAGTKHSSGADEVVPCVPQEQGLLPERCTCGQRAHRLYCPIGFRAYFRFDAERNLKEAEDAIRNGGTR